MRGLRAPIVNQGDDIVQIVVDTVLNASKAENFPIEDRDIVTITESIVARAQGNYATVDHIAADVREKFGTDTIGVVFPIFSRNRFAINLRGIARGVKHIYLMLNYPSDEVGNPLIDIEDLDEKGINPWTDVLTEEEFRKHFGIVKHPFTGIDYVQYYKEIVEGEGATCTIILANHPKTILQYTKNVLVCDIHSRFRTKKILKNGGAEKVIGLDDILTKPVDGSGYNEQYGLLGSNKATEDSVKLFPNNCQEIVDNIQAKLKEMTGKTVEVMIFGDGAFKDPVRKIWEFADPVVSPAYTKGLEGRPNEVKLKYLADNYFAHLSGEEQKKAIMEYIKSKKGDDIDAMESLGTTPRQITDLIGSLSDLTSGSGDKGTPFVYIKGYFDSYIE